MAETAELLQIREPLNGVVQRKTYRTMKPLQRKMLMWMKPFWVLHTKLFLVTLNKTYISQLFLNILQTFMRSSQEVVLADSYNSYLINNINSKPLCVQSFYLIIRRFTSATERFINEDTCNDLSVVIQV